MSGDDAKICGISYFSAVYIASGALITLMVFIWMKFDTDDPIRRMALVQGSLTIGLMFSLAWFQNSLLKRKNDRIRAAEKKFKNKDSDVIKQREEKLKRMYGKKKN